MYNRLILFLSMLLLFGCNNKKTDISPLNGEYFIQSLGANVNKNNIENSIKITYTSGNSIYRYGSLSANLLHNSIINKLSTYKEGDISITADASFINDDIITLSSSGELVRTNINKKGNIHTKWHTNFGVNFCSNLSTSIKNNIIIASCGTNIIKGFDIQNGKEIWHAKLNDSIASKPIFIDNAAIVFSKHDAIYSLDYISGSINWYLPEVIQKNHRALYVSMPLIIANNVIQQTADDQLRAVNPHNGNLEWIISISNTYENIKGKEFLIEYSNVAYDKANETLYVNNSNGEVISVKLHSSIINWKKPLVVSKPLWILDKLIIALNDVGNIIALSKSDGKIIWSNNLIEKVANKKDLKDIFGRPKPYNIVVFSAPIVVNNQIIVISSNNKLITIAPENGQILNIKDYGINIFGQPFVLQNKIYVLVENGSKLIQL